MSESVLTPQGVVAWASAHGSSCQQNPRFPGQLLLNNIKGTSIPVRIAFLPDRDLAWLQIELVEVVPEAKQAAIREAVTLLNATLFLGSWSFLSSSGKLIFKVTLPLQGAVYGPQALESVLQRMIGTVQQTARRLGAVAVQGAMPSSVVPKAAG